jgi:hypothetical protein
LEQSCHPVVALPEAAVAAAAAPPVAAAAGAVVPKWFIEVDFIISNWVIICWIYLMGIRM